MCIRIGCICIVTVIGADKGNAGLSAYGKELCIDQSLLRDSVILELEEEIALTEKLVIFKCGLESFFLESVHDKG